MTAQLSPDRGIGVTWKVGESEVNKILPRQELSEPEAFGGESKAEVCNPCASESPPMLTMQVPGPCARPAEQNSEVVSRSLHS